MASFVDFHPVFCCNSKTKVILSLSIFPLCFFCSAFSCFHRTYVHCIDFPLWKMYICNKSLFTYNFGAFVASTSTQPRFDLCIFLLDFPTELLPQPFQAFQLRLTAIKVYFHVIRLKFSNKLMQSNHAELFSIYSTSNRHSHAKHLDMFHQCRTVACVRFSCKISFAFKFTSNDLLYPC